MSLRPYRTVWMRVAAGGLALAVIVSGLSFAAAPDDEPKRDDKQAEPKKEPAKKETPKKKQPVPGQPFEGVFQNLPQGVDPEQLRNMQAEMQKMMREMQNQFPGGVGIGGGFAGGNLFGGSSRQGRLGVRIGAPNATLVDQLDLPKGQGIVIEEVQTDSAAAKAGIKNHDILLELNGKNVPADSRDFVKLVGEIKADKAVDAVVLRKGKRETIKGLTLPEAKADDNLPLFGGPAIGRPLGGPPAGFPGAPGIGGFQGGAAGAIGGLPPGGVGGFGGGAIGGQQVSTSVFRTDDRFTTRHQEGSLIITVTGTVDNGKAKVSSINVQDGRESHKYESTDKVPEQYRDKVNNLVEMSEKSGGRIEIKTPKIK
jgi:hypothetical protein